MNVNPLEHNSRRVLIRTFPPNTNANYGGILQAWALQRILKTMGYSVDIDSSQRHTRPIYSRTLRRVAKSLLRLAPLGTLNVSTLDSIYAGRLNSRILSFAQEHFHLVEIFDLFGNPIDTRARMYSTIVVGSDQVWRPGYVDVGSYLLDFIPTESVIRRIAYAASFGSDNPEFTERESLQLSELARRFNSISVREHSAIDICQQLWHVPAVQMPDPTLLLESAQYSPLYSHNCNKDSGVLGYILDPTPTKDALISQASALLDLPSERIQMRLTTRPKTRGQVNDYIRPSVGEWLASISNSSYIITDSFHGVVFSILFHRPFLAIANYERGLSRITSILEHFGLSERLAQPELPVSNAAILNGLTIDWLGVDSRLHETRIRGIEWLRDQLAP